MLLTGIRIAAVNAIGTAVFAAFVGGGGLGGLFNTAIRQRDMTMILLGTLVLMVMALVLDAGLGFVERRSPATPAASSPPRPGGWGRGGGPGRPSLVIYMLLPTDTSGQLILYDGDYTEVKLMHSMAEQLVEDKTDLEVVILDQMTQVNNYNELSADDPSCDLMFSYDGTVLTTFLGMDTTDIPEGETLYDLSMRRSAPRRGCTCWARWG